MADDDLGAINHLDADQNRLTIYEAPESVIPSMLSVYGTNIWFTDLGGTTGVSGVR